MNVLVLGGYGFIGSAVSRFLHAQGARVTAMVRHPRTGAKVLPGLVLVQGDLRYLLLPQNWDQYLNGVDAVINCAGALQDTRQDDLQAVHHTAIAALAAACAEREIPVVQISAIGAAPHANTAFMRTKAAGDAALQAAGCPLWILRPGLVIGQSDYGGTALLRMLAAIPLVQPVAYPETPVQCVGMPDLCHAIGLCLSGQLPQDQYDLVEDASHPLIDVLATTRTWLGFRPARATIPVPPVMTHIVAKIADGLAHMGWRSPLRRTAMTVMRDGVTGDAEPYRAVSGHSLAGLTEIYASLPCAREHRLTARMTLLMPLVVGILSLFWTLSGLIGLFQLESAAAVLVSAGWAEPVAKLSVVFWSLIDIALGLAMLWRPWAIRTCTAQVCVGVFYVLAASLTTPELWADPLGPLVKILPATLLSLVAIPMLEDR